MTKKNTLKINYMKRKKIKNKKSTLKKRNSKLKLKGGSNENNLTMELINTVITFYEALFIQGINTIGNLIGVDLTNEQEVKNKLSNIKNTLSNPELHREVYVVLEKMVVIGSIFYDVLKPHINEILNELNDKLEKAGTKLATTIEKIIVNVGKGIPLYGILVTIFDSATIATNTNAYIEEQKLSFYKTLAETWNKIKPDYERLLNRLDKIPNIENQLNTLKQFNDPTKMLQNNLSKHLNNNNNNNTIMN